MDNATVAQKIQEAVKAAFPTAPNIDFKVLEPGVREGIESTRIVANVDTECFEFGNPNEIELDVPLVVIGKPTHILENVTCGGKFFELELCALPQRQVQNLTCN